MPAGLRDRVHTLLWSWAPILASLDGETSLVHGDLGKRNIIVRRVSEKWKLVAVLDWEFAFSGSSLTDVGHFLRYEKTSRPLIESHLSDGYVEAGGKLPEHWRQVASVMDIASLCESLTRDQLPEDIIAELLELVSTVAEDHDLSPA